MRAAVDVVFEIRRELAEESIVGGRKSWLLRQYLALFECKFSASRWPYPEGSYLITFWPTTIIRKSAA